MDIHPLDYLHEAVELVIKVLLSLPSWIQQDGGIIVSNYWSRFAFRLLFGVSSSLSLCSSASSAEAGMIFCWFLPAVGLGGSMVVLPPRVATPFTSSFVAASG